MTTETMKFQAETQQLLDLMIHSLYRHEEIFLRELISNASDALDKLRFLALTQPGLLDGDERLHVRLEPDRAARTLAIADNGIGMTRDEVIANIGTIARSGAKAFVDQARAAAAGGEASSLPELIGRFGVGFYSAFMVADEVTVETRKAGAPPGEGVLWRSRGDGTFTLEAIERQERGTRIVLHLKPPAGRGAHGASDADEDTGAPDADFTDPAVLRSVVARYSDFVAYPIEMDETRTADGAETVTETRVLNSMKPLWTRAPAEIRADEHAEFYRHLTHDWEAPLAHVHFRAEGALDYTALLYLPAKRPPFHAEGLEERASRLSLYVRRVFIMADCDELLPPWLRFVRGLVDSADLPLNVSRESLQHNRQTAPIRKRLVRKVLDACEKLLADERAAYASFLDGFGAVLKEGLVTDPEWRAAIAKVCLFRSARPAGATGGDPDRVTLDEYVDRMPFKQDRILFLAGRDAAALRRSPYLERALQQGFEVLLLTDPVDEFAMAHLGAYREKEIGSLERADVDLGDAEEKQAREAKAVEAKTLLEEMRKVLHEHVSDVRLTSRLTESAAVLVAGEHDLTPQMARMLRESRHAVPESKPILELNPDHPLLPRLETLLAQEGAGRARFDDACELLLGQALLAQGAAPPDPARFNRLVADLMLRE